MEIKFCGMTRVVDAVAAAELGVEFVGLILAQSPRSVTVEAAREMIRAVEGRTTPVALFRDEPVGRLVDIVRALGVGTIQLHGRETASEMRRIAEELPMVRIIRAWELSRGGDVAALVSQIEEARGMGVGFYRVILDAPKGDDSEGRSGTEGSRVKRERALRPAGRASGELSDTLDDVFSQAAGVVTRLGVGVWRAGGLTPENVSRAVGAPGVVGIDVARGIESSPGIKDHEKMRRLIEAVRSIGGA